MPTPVFACGHECGVLGAAGSLFSEHWIKTGTGTSSLVTSGVITGGYSLRLNPTAATCGAISTGSAVLSAGGLAVWELSVKFTSLPSVTCSVTRQGNTLEGVYFNASDSKLYTGSSTAALGATGVSVTTGVVYRIAVKHTSAANPHLLDAQVDGVALGQKSTAVAANTTSARIALGDSTTAWTGDTLYDDLIASVTLADYPLGAGTVYAFVPTSDGTHNVAGTGDFQRTLTATDILNATTTAYQLVDELPLGGGADWINMLLPVNATDYVECVFGPGPGVSAPTDPPRAVEAHLAIHQPATGTGNMEVRLNDNGTMGTVYTATTVAGTTGVIYKRAHFADPPSAASAWVIGGGGDGDFTDLRVRFGSPAVLDVNPDQYFDGIVLEAEFATAVAPPSALVAKAYIFDSAMYRAHYW